MAEMGQKISLPCHFGLEAVLKREVQDLGASGIEVEDGRVVFSGGIKEAAKANVNLRTAERVMLECGRFRAVTFDELFEQVKAIPWEEILPKNARFWVKKVSSIDSALFSPPDIQSIIKKAMVERMKNVFGISWFPEDGAQFPFRVQIRKDLVSLCLDTSGESLHKRGYRVEPVTAPISETLAAGLVMLTPWHADRILADPCCGSGTIPIEAALYGMKIAPGLQRGFLMESWRHLDGDKAVKEAKEEAGARIRRDGIADLQGYDIDPHAVRCARINAEKAGVAEGIHFQTRALADFSHAKKYGFLISNPPYGERLEEKEALPALYRTFGEVYERLDSWSMYLITSYESAEDAIGRKADKNRKIYNGMIRSRYLQYLGPKPPKRTAR